MLEIARWLFIAGAVPFLLLGAAHAFATPTRKNQRKGLSPRDPSLPETMEASALGLTSRTNVWLAWVGFNFSHSLGAVLFGAVVLINGRSQASFGVNAPIFVPFAVIVSAAYLVLALRYWFRTPIAGCAASFLLFALSWLTQLI